MSEEVFGFIENETAREKLKKSEDKIRLSYSELFRGYNLKAEDVLDSVDKVENYNGLVIMKDIQFYSMCEHHLVPFFGTVDIYYKPSELIAGLGRLVKLAKDVHGSRLQFQETMTRDICQDIMRILKADGCFVRTTAKHLCVCSRGVQDDLATTVCTYAEGSLSDWIITPKNHHEL